MKLSSTLLSAILLGITLQTTVACNKEKIAEKKETKKEEKAPPADPCPACGMG